VSSSDAGPPDPAHELLRRWQEHDDVDALDQLLRSEVEVLARRLRSRGRGRLRPSVSASDLAQEAVFRLLRLDDVPEFHDPRELRAYLWTAAWRLLLNRSQRPGRSPMTLSQAQSCELAVALHGAGGGTTVERDDQALALNVVLNLLRPEDREVLDLVYFQHVSIEAAAERLGVQRAALEMRLTRARRRLAEKIVGWSELID